MKREAEGFEAGDKLVPITKAVTGEVIKRFELLSHALRSQGDAARAPDLADIHTDRESARKLGFREPVASAQLSFAYLHELLDRSFGVDFRQGGELAITFLEPVYENDVLTAGGAVKRKDLVAGGAAFELDVWLENQEGRKTAIGQARVKVPSPLT